ncbi:MAG TPA: hypothetical protein VHU18_07465 [Rhizomicrobium sp.]|nr:hypothetical protein [Rhizomicrobium sp.]
MKFGKTENRGHEDRIRIAHAEEREGALAIVEHRNIIIRQKYCLYAEAQAAS